MTARSETVRKIGKRAVIGTALGLGGCFVLNAAGVVISTWQKGQPDWDCRDIPEGLGPKQALEGLGVWAGVDTFPIQVKVPQPDGEFETHQANTADEFDPPYGFFDFDYGDIPAEKGGTRSQVCFDRKRFPPRPSPNTAIPTPQSLQRKGRPGHHVVYNRTWKR